MRPPIAIMTDFGLNDTYVGVMKGVILGICPDVAIVDLTHSITPQDVRQAAFQLMNAYSYLPVGTVFLVVVDPGVGSTRRPVAVQIEGYTFVAPDNGVLSYALAQSPVTKIVELSNNAYQLSSVSTTFHGRDIFAPAAGHIASGVELDELGEPLDALIQLPLPELVITPERIYGEVLDIDRFGNVITSIGQLQWLNQDELTMHSRFDPAIKDIRIVSKNIIVTFGDQKLTSIRPTYSEVMPGELLMLVGSSGYLELAVNQGNAAQRFNVKMGDRVELVIGDGDATVRD